LNQKELYIKRCIELANKAGKEVKSNPKVGAVLVHKDRIIGEGYHKKYGDHHAEVNTINSVKEEDRKYISDSTLYVSLEPCRIVSKTPACTDLILKHKIKKLVVSTTDPNAPMAGRSLLLLGEKGVDITTGILEKEGRRLIAPFIQNLAGLPYITLKWAKSKDNFIGIKEKQVWLSNEYSKAAAHKLRAENDAILIGTNTAILDNPQLTTRNHPGKNPLRIVIDRQHKIPLTHHLLSDEYPTLALSQSKRDLDNPLKNYVKVNFEHPAFLENLMKSLYNKGISRILIEGGSGTLKGFIKANLWHQGIIFETDKIIEKGIKAPHLEGKLWSKKPLDGDKMIIIDNADS
jgi:diaminohydroxyphosphoribosylaminopyrimidine deaminase/5-amino-6-(5-phosphoribosylamino)uracil reductase